MIRQFKKDTYNKFENEIFAKVNQMLRDKAES